jgi:ATP:ADP antiporter, AAA family
MFWRVLGLHQATRSERYATIWIAAMFCASLCSMFLLRPLRGQFGVDSGVGAMPALYSLTLLATVLLIVPFWALANRMPSGRFVKIALNVGTVALIALAAGLSSIGDYQWSEDLWIGRAFWGGFSALNVAVPALVWIHAVEHFGPAQAKRLFGLIAVGGTVGAVLGSYLAKIDGLPVWSFALVSAFLLQLAQFAFLRSRVYCQELEGGASQAQFAKGGLLQGLRIIALDRRALQIAVYTLLVGFVATSFEAAQTELVGEYIDRARQQKTFLADVGLYGSVMVLLLQVFCTGRMMPRMSAIVLLASLPVVSILGLSLYALIPTAGVIFVLQVARRGANYAFEKPAREVLYTPLDLATKHKVKFLLDTFALRLGDLSGAFVQVWLRDWGVGIKGIVAVTILVAVIWIGLAVSLGRSAKETPSSS